MKGWIPENLYKKIIKEMPVPCVDAVILDKGKVLLMKRNNPPRRGWWWIPGGRIRRGESLSKALLRQAKEETGLACMQEDINILTRITGHKMRRSWKEGDQFHFLIKKVR